MYGLFDTLRSSNDNPLVNITRLLREEKRLILCREKLTADDNNYRSVKKKGFKIDTPKYRFICITVYVKLNPFISQSFPEPPSLR